MDRQVYDYREVRKRLPHLEDKTISNLLLAASIERAAERIAHSINNLEIRVVTKKPEGL